ncbi:histidine--tRNA ligase [Cytophagaceae bacterium ABcell3]|nr:histidine--tRNA ligase [Cytophagaceae bacterium ABcell3]
MSEQKPTLPKGTRDFGPDKMVRRNYIFNIIRRCFHKYGFLPLETPALENLSVLTGKYGDEGDKLIFKILNSGDFLKKVTQEDINQGAATLTPKISEKALKYDLTVPFARYVVMNRHEITFPFKRFQIQPVWRADNPQKGRYREFYQCDADVIGTRSLICEAELIMLLNEVFSELNIEDISIKINNRKVLSGITEIIGKKGSETDLCVAIDKLDKIGREGVTKELQTKGFSDEEISCLDPLFNLSGNHEHVITALKELLATSEVGLQGVEELEQVYEYLIASGYEGRLPEPDITLARGLNYYTGAILEVKVNNVKIGSISGGGRYDNLTGVFGMPDVSGVGISFGVDRIYDVMEELNLFPTELQQASSAVLVASFDKESEKYSLSLIRRLREAGISSEMYPEPVKMKKQLNYANAKNIPNVIIIGSEEISSGLLSIKNMETGNQAKKTVDEIIAELKP